MKPLKLLIFVSVYTLFCISNGFAIELFEMGRVDIHGFISQGAMGSSANNFFADTDEDGSFQFNEAALNFSSQVSDRLRVGAQLLAMDLGKMGNKEMQIDWAFADYSIRDWLNIRAGKVKMSFGLHNASRDVDMLRTFVFLPQSVYNEAWRDTVNALNGASVYGYIPIGYLGNLTYYIQGGVASIDKENGAARLLEDQTHPTMNVDVLTVDMDYTNAANLIWEPVEGIKLGGGFWELGFKAPCNWNHVFSDPDTLVTNTSDFDLDMFSTLGFLELSYGDLTFTAEYMTTAYEMTLNGASYASGIEFDSEGYYASLTYRVFDWLELGAYYSEYYPDKDDKDGKDGKEAATSDYVMDIESWLKDTCVAFRFDISANWIFKLEAHNMDGAAILLRSDDNLDDEKKPLYERYWQLYAAKLSFSF